VDARTLGALAFALVFLAGASRRRRDRPGKFWSWSEVYADQADRTMEADAYASALATVVLDPLRESIGQPLTVSSWFRSAAHNKAIGGVEDSHHLTGGAVDLLPAPGWDAVRMARELVRLGVPFDEVIAYSPERGGHLHVTWLQRYGPPTAELLYAPPQGGFVQLGKEAIA